MKRLKIVFTLTSLAFVRVDASAFQGADETEVATKLEAQVSPGCGGRTSDVNSFLKLKVEQNK